MNNLMAEGCLQGACSIKHYFFNTSNKGKHTGKLGDI